jgi:enoyl-CoA hydratase/carnithine racemase
MAPPLSEDESGEDIVAEPGGVEFAKPTQQGEAVEEAPQRPPAEELEEVGLYHPVVPELLEAFTEAVEILEKLAEGRLSPSEAKAYYIEKVKTAAEAVAIDTTKSEAKKRSKSKVSSAKTRRKRPSRKKKS